MTSRLQKKVIHSSTVLKARPSVSRCLTANPGKVLVRWHRKSLRTVELALASEAIEQRRDRVRPVSAIDEIADRFRQHENRDRQQDQRQHAAENEKSLPTEV